MASMPLQIDAELIVDPSTTRVTVQVAPATLSTVL